MIRNGQIEYGDGEYEEALESYNTALDLVPGKDYEIYYRMGLVYQKLGDADKELEAFERSVALNPGSKNVDAIQHLAEVLFYRKRDATRADLYDKEARGQGSIDYNIQKELGDLCYKYESYSWAKIKYNNTERILKREITGGLKTAIESGDESEAKQIVDDPSKVTLKLVSEAASSGNQLAAEALKKVAPLLADYRFVGSRMAVSQIRLKQYDQAQRQLEELKGDDPNAPESAEFHYAMAELALAQEDKDTGMAEIKRALEIDPEHKEASDRLKELDLGSPSTSETSESEASG
jgi:tetratricopeptide (TPR) repeat protein